MKNLRRFDEDQFIIFKNFNELRRCHIYLKDKWERLSKRVKSKYE